MLGRLRMTKYSESLKGTKDIMKELNKDGGRYLPVWMKPPSAKKGELSLKKSDATPRRKPSGKRKKEKIKG